MVLDKEKEILRNQLFDKYFEVENGILATNLVDKLSFIPDLWKKLHTLCEKNIRHFDAWSTLEKFKLVEHKQHKYLILKLRMFRYVIIDIEKMENITEELFRSEFNENFFINNFNEIKDCRDLFKLYNLYEYKDVQELISFYFENKALFQLSTKLHYRLEINEAWTYFYIDFANAEAQMGFQTKDQYLHEQLFLRYDLTPSSSQDAQNRIGIEKMQEMFDRVKDLKIPREVIPKDLYQQFLNQINSEMKLIKMKTNTN